MPATTCCICASVSISRTFWRPGEHAHVALEMLRRETVIDSLVGALQGAPERFHAIGVSHATDELANAVLDRLVLVGESLVRAGIVRVDLRANLRVLVHEPCSVFLSVESMTLAATRFVARSFMRPLPSSRPDRGQLSASSSRACSSPAPPMYVSSTSTGPSKTIFTPLNASRMRWSMNHAVACLTPRSRCSFMLDTPFRFVISR